jgi:hypothetical protein
LSASTWVALANLAGFTSTLTVAGVTARLAWLMPVAVDGYVVVALVLWMSPVPTHVARFAKRNTYGAAGIGICAQSAYHLLFTASTTNQTWRVVLAAIVGALPPAVAGLAVHMRALLNREHANPTVAVPPVVVPVEPIPAPTPPTPSVLTTVPQPTTPAEPIAPAPDPAPAVVTVAPVTVPAPAAPTPAELAARITRPTPGPGTDRAAVSNRTDRPAARPRPARPDTIAAPLAPPATDIPVTAPGAAQPMLPLVDPAKLARARELARQYRIDNGVPMSANRLAVALRVPTGEAAQLLAALDQAQDSSTRPTNTVNGYRPAGANL